MQAASRSLTAKGTTDPAADPGLFLLLALGPAALQADEEDRLLLRRSRHNPEAPTIDQLRALVVRTALGESDGHPQAVANTTGLFVPDPVALAGVIASVAGSDEDLASMVDEVGELGQRARLATPRVLTGYAHSTSSANTPRPSGTLSAPRSGSASPTTRTRGPM